MSEQRTSKTILGPITFDMYVHVQNADGTLRGKVTVGISPGNVPSYEQVIKAIGNGLAALPEDYELMEPDNFVSLLMEEKLGAAGEWAAPASMRYDVAAIVKQATEAAQESSNDE